MKTTPTPGGNPPVRPNVPKSRASSATTAIISIIALVLLMAYSIVMLTLGYSPQITLAAAAVLCGLAIELVRRTLASHAAENSAVGELTAGSAPTEATSSVIDPPAGTGTVDGPA